jgi:zinc protease
MAQDDQAAAATTASGGRSISRRHALTGAATMMLAPALLRPRAAWSQTTDEAPPVEAPAPAPPRGEPVTPRQMSDRLVVIPARLSRTVEFRLIVHAGMADEGDPAIRGISHYLEHLILVGRNADHENNALRFFGDGTSNGWTNPRATAYVHGFPARADGGVADLTRLFRFYAERLESVAISDAEAERERNVVRQENDWRYGGSPYVPVWRAVNLALLPGHPLADAHAGSPETIARYTLAAARDYHRRWYRRANTTVIVMGPVDPDAVQRVADEAFRGLPDTPVAPRRWLEAGFMRLEPTAIERRVQHPRIQRPSVHLSRYVEARDGEAARTNAARTLLNSYLASRLAGSPSSRLVEQEGIAASIGINLSRPTAGLYQVSASATPEPEVRPERLMAALQREVQRVSENAMDQATLDRLRRRAIEATDASRRDGGQVLSAVVDWAAYPLPLAALLGWREALQRVTLDDIRALAAVLVAPGREARIIFEGRT